MVHRNFQAVCIKPRSPFHIGEAGIGIEKVAGYPHSDTLFSAICLSHLQLYGEVDFLRNFKDGSPPFLLSSAFPYYKVRDKMIFFFPKPHVPLWSYQESRFIKDLKDVHFLSKQVFEEWLAEGFESVLEGLKSGRFRIVDKSILTSVNEVDFLETEKLQLCRDLTTPRNRLNRLNMSSDLYYAGATLYHLNSGMYFLLDLKENSEFFGRVFCCLNLLRDEGIGGERTIGYGRFDYFSEKLDILEPDDAEAFLTLSLYHPTLEEVEKFLAKKERWSYRLITRGGYPQSPLIRHYRLRRSVRMMVEGSVFPKVEGKNVYGDFLEVLTEEETGAHAVYRYGYAFPIAIKV